MGQTARGRRLLGTRLIRMISGRDMNRREEERGASLLGGERLNRIHRLVQAQRRRFPNLKPSLKTISLRLPASMIEELKVLAHKRDVPYQSLLKVFLAERIQQERRRP
jgi:predicted DNA binding CopG/RHH family protein